MRLEGDWIVGSVRPDHRGRRDDDRSRPGGDPGRCWRERITSASRPSAENGYQSTFASSELASMFSAYMPPTLVVTYVPEPAMGLVVLPLLALRPGV